MHPEKNDIPRIVEGSLVSASHQRFAIIASRFNDFIVERLIEGAVDALNRHGVSNNNIDIVRVPGSWEIPTIVARVASHKKHAALIALGAVIRGGTPHFDYVAAEVSKGVAAVSLQTQIPISFGILTTDSIEQAIERAGTKHGNKGWDAALSALEMASLSTVLDSIGL